MQVLREKMSSGDTFLNSKIRRDIVLQKYKIQLNAQRTDSLSPLDTYKFNKITPQCIK